jgi:predicted dehydrogenase
MGRTVLRQLQTHPAVSALIGFDPDPASRDKASGIGGVDIRDDLDAVWADPEVRLVFVTSPNHTHEELAIRALRANKAVMLEKPVARTLSGAAAVAAEAAKPGAFLQVGFEARYSRLYELGKEAIDSGAIGTVVNMHCNYICCEFHHKGSWRNFYETGGGMFGEKLCHYVDLPRWWTNSEIEEIHSVCAPNVVPYYEVRDNYHCIYRMSGGAVGHLTFMMYVATTFEGDPLQNTVDQQMDDGHELRCLVVGTGGAIDMDVFRRRFRRWEFGDSEKCITSHIVQDETWPSSEDDRYFHDTLTQAHDVVDRVLANRPPRTSASDAFETMRVVAAAEHSAHLGRAVRIEELATLGDFPPRPATGP